MAGYRTYLELKSTEERANKLGFRFAHSKYGSREEDTIALFPKDDMLPVFARDVELYCGTLTQIRAFLAGVEHRENYLMVLKATSQKKIETAEQHIKEEHLIEKIKTGKNPPGVRASAV